MAALTLVATLAAASFGVGTGNARADADPKKDANPAPGAPPTNKPTPTPNPGSETGAEASKSVVRLRLAIAGLPAKGCDVSIKPAHPGCKFRVRTEHVGSEGLLDVKFDDVEVRNANRDCTFAITVKEAGQADRTWRRGLRVAGGDGEQTLLCYFSSPSRLAKAESEAAEKSKRR